MKYICNVTSSIDMETQVGGKLIKSIFFSSPLYLVWKSFILNSSTILIFRSLYRQHTNFLSIAIASLVVLLNSPNSENTWRNLSFFNTRFHIFFFPFRKICKCNHLPQMHGPQLTHVAVRR